MDLSVKTIFSCFFTFIATMLILSMMIFYVGSTQAREVMYSVVENIEEYGYDAAFIDEYARKTNTNINVTPINIDDDSYKYQVSVSYDHTFAFINLDEQIAVSAVTRKVQY